MDLEKIKQLNLPKSPGCYQFKDKTGKIIYIGKAANLRSRVLSYWRESANHSPAKYSMLKKITKIYWIETDSEIEALLLEANLIKKHRSEYNISLRDDKRHVYIKISTEEDWPRIFMTRKLEKAGRYFGPFVSVEAVRETLKIIRKIWPYRSCKNLPKKVCLYYRIGKCAGMCEEKITKQEYGKVIKQIVLFLENKKKKIVSDIEKDIGYWILDIKKLDNKEREDEIQKKIDFAKYQLINIKKVLEHANILSLMDKYASDVVELAKVLGLPKVPNRIEGYDISNIFGKEAVGSMVVFNDGEPNKSEYRKFKIKIEDELGDVGMLREILERRFRRIQEDPLLVSPLPRGRNSNDNWALPDLIIVDGGKAQLNVAVQVVKNAKLDIPVMAISKGKGLRSAQAPDKIFFPGEKKPLVLPLASPALHIIKRVRDEAHRFAITYHKLLRKKKFLR